MESSEFNILGLFLALCLAWVHAFASRSQWLASIPRPWWVSFAGGISIAYIFLEVFPELSQAQITVEQSDSALIKQLENHVYLFALAGLAVFYGLEALATRLHRLGQKKVGGNSPDLGVFGIHIILFAIYNAVLGYLLKESTEHELVTCLLLFVTLSVHFIVNDMTLRKQYQKKYDHLGRWLLAAAFLLGWIVGQVVHLNEVGIASIWAFISGGIILNVLKEELPEQRESHFVFFIVGSVAYTIVLFLARP